jgi:hypothetical protein
MVVRAFWPVVAQKADTSAQDERSAKVIEVPHVGTRFAEAVVEQSIEPEPTLTEDGAMSKRSVTVLPEREIPEIPAADTPEDAPFGSTPALTAAAVEVSAALSPPYTAWCVTGVAAAAETATLPPIRASGATTRSARSVNVRRRERGADAAAAPRRRVTR